MYKTEYVIVSCWTSISTLLLAAFVFWKGRRNRLNIIYALWALCVGLWSFFLVLNILAPSQQQALLWCRSLHVWAIVIPAVYVHFVLLYIGQYEAKRKIVYALYLVSAAFLLLDFTPWFLASEYRSKFDFHVSTPKPLYLGHLAVFLGSITYVYFELITSYFRTKGNEQTRIKYFFIATISAYTGGITNYLINYDILLFPIYPYGNLGVLLYVALMGVVIVKYNFLDIEVIIKRTLTFTVLLLCAYGGAALITHVISLVFGGMLSERALLFMHTVVLVILIPPLKGLLARVTDRFLFQGEYSYEDLNDILSAKGEITDLKWLANDLAHVFTYSMRLEDAVLWVIDREEGAYRPLGIAGVQFVRTDALPAAASELVLLSRPHEAGVITAEHPRFNELIHFFQSARRVDAFIRIMFKEELLGVLVLGKKKSDREFSREDVHFLTSASKIMATQLNNAISFEIQRQFFALQAEKNRTDMLGQLSAGLDHEIKNPLNQSMPRMELIMSEAQSALGHITEKSFHDDPVTAERFQKTFGRILELARVARKNEERIVSIMSRLRRFSRPLPEDRKINYRAMNLLSSIKEAVGLISETRLRDDSVVVECSVEPDLYVRTDETLLVQVLYNVINNAYHAINQNGTITIGAEPLAGDGRIRVSIKDTGHGIKMEHRRHIFDAFFTTKPTNPQEEGVHRFRGTGLGLGLVKRYLEECGGAISFESEVGRGTTFFLDFVKANVSEGETS